MAQRNGSSEFGRDLLANQRRAWLAGECPAVEHLIQQHRKVTAISELLLDLIYNEFCLAKEIGRAISPDEFVRRFPQYECELRKLFEVHQAMETPGKQQGNAATESKPDSPANDVDALTSCPDSVSKSTIDRPSPQRLPHSHQIGKYEVADVLGRGGQAVTYLAFDPDLRRKVVIKEYHARGGEIEHEAVLNEGRSLARINSRYVAKCLTVERLGDHIYLVMEHIPGKNLWDAAHEQSFEFTQAAQLVAQIAEGLSDVHRCGILHRDIKPANIIVHADGTARLVDFGLAATLSSSALESIGGTLQFMAPEQAVGDSDQIDWRADLFGLGAVLYWLVTGRPPYEGNNRDDIWRKAQRGEFLKPRDVNPQVPPELERICLKAMATRPSGRYGTADRFARALRRYLRGRASGLPSSETVAVSPPDQFVSNPAVDTRSSTASGIETAPEYARRRVPRWIAPIVVALGIMLAMILTTVLWKSNPDGSQSGILVSGTGPIQVEKFDIQVSPQGRAFVAVDRAVPLRLGDSVHFSVRLSRPAHVRLLWIDARGKAEELYPNDPEFGRRETEPVMEFESPLQLDRGWPLRDLVGGREIALLLVNAGPLPDIALRPSLLASPADNERQVARFTATRTEAPARLGLVATSMRALGHDSQRIDDPTYQLLEELRKQCDMVRAISIPVSTSHD